MSANRSEYLNLGKPLNYIHYLIGIAVESAAIGMLMIIAYIISGLGIGLPR
jgi:hypothetical protein